MFRLFLSVLCLFLSFSPALAEEGDAHKWELAKQMQELRPVRGQVEHAIDIAAQRLPEEQRSAFEAAMMRQMDFQAIDKIATDFMAETFTEAELAAMVEYYSKPEAKSAADKLPQYQEKVGPEIIRMIDKAMMKLKTGQ
ncbi:MAG: hypothetical protein LRY54_03795 [Alphaproteobacteria bacterium]|nr:hypothetical protein [Alphaproteobacteria bacterium]